MARLKLQAWDACIDDSIKAIELDHGNMKGYYYLAQAQLALNHPNEAFTSALTAYERCIETSDKSTTAVSNLVLQAKKQKWEARERERIKGRSELLRELEDGLMRRKKEELQSLKFKLLDFSEEAEEKADIELGCRKKIEELRSIFAVADPKNMQRRVRAYTRLKQNKVPMGSLLTVKTGGPRLSHRQHILHSNARPGGNKDG